MSWQTVASALGPTPADSREDVAVPRAWRMQRPVAVRRAAAGVRVDRAHLRARRRRAQALELAFITFVVSLAVLVIWCACAPRGSSSPAGPRVAPRLVTPFAPAAPRPPAASGSRSTASSTRRGTSSSCPRGCCKSRCARAPAAAARTPAARPLRARRIADAREHRGRLREWVPARLRLRGPGQLRLGRGPPPRAGHGADGVGRAGGRRCGLAGLSRSLAARD